MGAAGCSIKLVYNNADRLIRWEVSDFIQFDRDQRRYFDAAVAEFLYWHRQTQLPLYAELFASMPDRVERGISVEEFVALAATVEDWGAALECKALPIATQMLLSLSAEQARALPQNLAGANDEFLKDERNKTLEQDQRRWRKAVGKGFRRFVGRLNAQQQAYLADMASQYRSERDLWVAYRQRWQAQLLILLADYQTQVLTPQQFADAMVVLSQKRQDYYGEFAQVSQSNRALGASVSAWMLSNLSAAQQARFRESMEDIAQDLQELAAELPAATPPPVPCLVPLAGCPPA